MSDTPAPAPAHAEEAQPKKKKTLLLIIIAVVVLAAGGGGAFMFLKRGNAEAAETEKAEKEKKPEKEKKKKADEEDEEEDDEEAAEETAAAEGEGAAKPVKSKFSIKKLDLPDDKDVKKVIQLEPFVVNLADKGETHYLRMSISLGIGETKEEKPDPLLLTKVRNAMLAVITTKSSEEVLTQQGKSVLRKELLKAARAAIEEPYIEAIYITDFIVQL